MSDDALVVEIRNRLDYEALFSEYLDLHGSGAERTAKCVFHDDRTPSMSVNVEDGLYCCHNPQCGASGDVFSFFQRIRSLSFPEALTELAKRVGVNPEEYRTPRRRDDSELPNEEQVLQQFLASGARVQDLLPPTSDPDAQERPRRRDDPDPDNVIDEAIVDSAHHRLINDPVKLEVLATRRGLSMETVTAFKLGYDGQRYFIPVRDAEGRCVNIRRYKPDARESAMKMISWREGFGRARLFPLDKLTDDAPVYLMEGEMDCLLARQLGLNAITATGGAGTWRERWNTTFTGRHVVICYDNDEAGRVGAQKVATQFSQPGVAASVKVVTIPLAEPAGADFTDYIVGHGHTVEDFLTLVEHTPFFQATDEPVRTVGTLEPTV